MTAGTSIDFTITASDQTTGKNVVLSVSKTGGDFITPAEEVTYPLLDSDTMTTYSVSTTDSDADTNDTDTTVTVTLLDRTGYTLADSPNHMASVMVTDGTDGLPVINIAAATGGERVAEGSSVRFTFTSNPPLADTVDVMVSLTETGSFLTPAAKTKGNSPITLRVGETQTEQFDVTTANETFDPDSTVTLTLVADDSKYVLGSSTTARVVVEDVSTPTGISIAALEQSVTEGDPSDPTNTYADFQIKADAVDTSSRVINIAISQGDLNFLSNTTLMIDTVTIDADERSVDLAVPIESDTDPEISGEITIEIADADGSSATYTKASSYTSASIVVHDNDLNVSDTDDSVGIIAVKSMVSETETAPFQIVAKTENETDDRTIMVMIANKGSGNFLPDTTYDSAIPVVINMNTLFTNFDVMLDNDSKYETSGAITATIVAETGGGTPTYSLGAVFSAEIAVTSEDPEVPVISIASATETNGVTEGHEFKFTVTSDRSLGGNPLDISFSAIHSITGATIDVDDVRILGDMQTATGTVSLSEVDVTSNTDIMIKIDDIAEYDVSESDPSIMVTVKDNDTTSGANPRVSIALTSANFSTTRTRNYRLSLPLLLLTQLLVRSVVIDVTKTGGDFITPATEVSVPLLDSQTTTTHIIPTTDPNLAADMNDTDTFVTVTLLERTGYTLADAPNHMASAVLTDGADGLSTISVAAATAEGRVAEGNDVEFTFTSDPPLVQPVTVQVTITETGDFLETNAKNTTTVDLQPGLPHTEPFNTITANGDFDPDSTVTLTLGADDDNYNLGSIRTASVVIEDDVTTTQNGVSVIALEESITEAPNTDANFQIKADTFNSSSRVINISVSQGDVDFLSNTTLMTDTVTIPRDARTVDLPVPIESDSNFEISGNITVTIQPADVDSATYNLANDYTSASILVIDSNYAGSDQDDSVSILRVKDSVEETEMAPFQVIAKTANETDDRTIMVMVANKGSGNFLPDTTYDSAIPVVINMNTLFTNFDVMLDNDSKYEPNGAITATIVETGGTPTYSLGSVISAEIEVISEDLEVPVLTLSSAAETDNLGVTEGLSFTFKVVSDTTITAGQRLTFMAPVVSDNQDESAANPISPSIVETSFRIAGNTSEAVFTVQLADNGTIDPGDDVSVTVALLEGVEYDTGAKDSITVRVKDSTGSNALPAISIANDANYIADGSMASFTVTASHLPSTDTDVTVMFTIDGDFLTTGEDTVKTPTITSAGDRTATVMYDTEVDSPFAGNGTVTATLIDGAGYAITSTAAERSASIAVLDALPVISISEISAVDEVAEMFTITLTSDIQLLENRDLTIDTLRVVDADNDAPQYAPQIATSPIIITNTSVDNAEPVNVTFTKVANNYSWDNLTVSLADGSANYTADPNADERTVTIRPEELSTRLISIDAPISVVEEDAIMLTLTASEALGTGELIMVELNVSDSTGTFLDPSFDHTMKYEINENSMVNSTANSVSVMIPTRKQTATVDGAISIAVVRGPDYEPHSTNGTKTVTIQEEDLLPKIFIGIAPMTSSIVDEGKDVKFELSATATTPPTTDSFTVFVQVEDDNTYDFLADAQTDEFHEVIITSGGVAPLVIPTVADADDEGTGGMITATIQSDQNADRTTKTTYLPATPNTPATAMITDNDDATLPSVTISAGSAIIEGDEAEFTLATTGPALTAPLVVSILYDEMGSFIDRNLDTDSIIMVTIPDTGPNAGTDDIFTSDNC